MKKGNDLNFIKRLVRGAAHVPPSVEILKSELRSDSGFEVPVQPGTATTNYILIKWTFHVRTRDLDAFHGLLAQNEDLIIADTENLSLGVAYLGTYAEMPGGNLHQTFWSYDTMAAVDAFQASLAQPLQADLRNHLRQLVAFIDDPAMSMRRMVRAKELAGMVASQRASDPILDMFAGVGPGTS